MLYLKCTALVQKALGLPKTHITAALPSEAPLGNWYVNRFELGRRKAYLFMSEPTFLSFILLQGKKPVTVETPPQMMIGGLEQLLDMGGLGDDAIKRAVAHYHTGAFAKTDSRSDLGSLNDLMLRYQWIIEREGGLHIAISRASSWRRMTCRSAGLAGAVLGT